MNAVGDIILPALYNKIHLVSSNDNISEKLDILNDDNSIFEVETDYNTLRINSLGNILS